MKVKNLNDLAVEVCKREHGKVNLTIAQVKEVIKCICDIELELAKSYAVDKEVTKSAFELPSNLIEEKVSRGFEAWFDKTSIQKQIFEKGVYLAEKEGVTGAAAEALVSMQLGIMPPSMSASKTKAKAKKKASKKAAKK